ncbi:hypothetical protein DM01DRAFT_1116235 [Hesseltinella vesiculosa]|uniref:Uncharacterized protein n=1 Tax=Hesseltinella vesiculosa TaxID=101127 RepID=A0A1X2G9E6_9FUNG|nr:hypothetical protein DM01DRAFT_1116235 [Hesseltinella vesiculosa]
MKDDDGRGLRLLRKRYEEQELCQSVQQFCALKKKVSKQFFFLLSIFWVDEGISLFSPVQAVAVYFMASQVKLMCPICLANAELLGSLGVAHAMSAWITSSFWLFGFFDGESTCSPLGCA